MLKQFQFSALTDSLIKVLNQEGHELKIQTPTCLLVSDLEHYTFQHKKHYFIRLEVPEEFASSIQTFEQLMLDKFTAEEKTAYTLRSQLTLHDYKEPVLKVKVKQAFNKFTSRLTRNGVDTSFYELQPYDEVQGFLTANVFKGADLTLVVKWSIDSLRIIS